MDVGTTEDVHLFVSDPKEAPHHDPIKKTDILNSNPDEMRTKHWPDWLSFALYSGILCIYITVLELKARVLANNAGSTSLTRLLSY